MFSISPFKKQVRASLFWGGFVCLFLDTLRKSVGTYRYNLVTSHDLAINRVSFFPHALSSFLVLKLAEQSSNFIQFNWIARPGLSTVWQDKNLYCNLE